MYISCFDFLEISWNFLNRMHHFQQKWVHYPPRIFSRTLVHHGVLHLKIFQLAYRTDQQSQEQKWRIMYSSTASSPKKTFFAWNNCWEFSCIWWSLYAKCYINHLAYFTTFISSERDKICTIFHEFVTSLITDGFFWPRGRGVVLL